MTLARVHIVDDDRDVRESTSFLVNSVGWQSFLYSSAQEFIDNYEPCGKDCVLLDIRMPGDERIGTAKTLRYK